MQFLGSHGGAPSDRDGDDLTAVMISWNRRSNELSNLLFDALMWSCPIEILDIRTQYLMELLLMVDQHVGKRTLAARSPESVPRSHWGVSPERVL
jgi:hypothetical protein